jgi:hypothetical protein
MSESKQSAGGDNETIHPRTLDQVPNVITGYPPAAAFYEGKIYLAYTPNGDQFSGQIWTTNFDGTNWSQPVQLSFPSNTFDPALVVWQGLLICAADSGEQAWYMTFDGNTWAPGQAIPNSPSFSSNPALAANSTTLYVAYLIDGEGGDVSYQTFDGTNWSQPAPTHVVTTSGGVGLAADPYGNVYLAYQSVDSQFVPNGQIWYTTFNGKNWSAPVQVPNAPIFSEPALAFYNETLYCLHLRPPGNNGSKLWYLGYVAGVWSGDTPVSTSTASYQTPAIAPVLANFANRGPGLYFFITTTGNHVSYFYQ